MAQVGGSDVFRRSSANRGARDVSCGMCVGLDSTVVAPRRRALRVHAFRCLGFRATILSPCLPTVTTACFLLTFLRTPSFRRCCKYVHVLRHARAMCFVEVRMET